MRMVLSQRTRKGGLLTSPVELVVNLILLIFREGDQPADNINSGSVNSWLVELASGHRLRGLP